MNPHDLSARLGAVRAGLMLARPTSDGLRRIIAAKEELERLIDTLSADLRPLDLDENLLAEPPRRRGGL